MNDERNEVYYSFFEKAVEYYEAEKYIPALAFFERAAELGDTNISINAYLAGCYKEIEEYEKSLESYNKIIAELEQSPFIQDDDDPLQFYSNRAFVNIALEKYDEAIIDYNRAIEIENDNAFYYNGRAQAYYLIEKYAEALFDMSQAISLDDSVSWFWERRAAIFNELGKNEQSSYDTFRAYLAQCSAKDNDDEESKPTLENNIIFSEDVFTLVQNSSLQEGMEIVIQSRDGVPSLPEMFYDGGNNALLRRRFDSFVFIKNIPSDMREKLLNAETVFVNEIIMVDDDGNKISEDDYKTLNYKMKIRKCVADDSLESIDAIIKHGYFFFAYLASRIRARPDKPINEIIGIEDYANLAAVLSREEDYENLQRFHDDVCKGDEGPTVFANLVLNKQISFTFQDWKPTPLFYITGKKSWASLNDGVKMLRFLASLGSDPNVPSGDGDTALYNQCLKFWNPTILQTLLEVGANPNQECEMEEGTFPVFSMTLLPDDYDEETNLFSPLNEKHLERIKMLVDCGADVTYTYGSGETLLTFVLAYSEGAIREELVRLFLDKGANVKAAIKGLKKGLANGMSVYQKTLDDLPTIAALIDPPPVCLDGCEDLAENIFDITKQVDDEIREEMKNELREYLEEIKKPATVLSFTRMEIPLNNHATSHAGDLPYFEEGCEWPCKVEGAEKQYYDFVFQIFQDDEGSVALPEGVKLLQYFTLGTYENLFIIWRELNGKPVMINVPEGVHVRPNCMIETENIFMLPDPEDIKRFNSDAAELIGKLFGGHLDAYELIGLTVDDPGYQCFVGGYPRWHTGGGGGIWLSGELLCQLDLDEDACIDFGDSTLEAFINLETDEIETKIHHWS
jgi:hypothetical protein